jgi:hypothetical protein
MKKEEYKELMLLSLYGELSIPMHGKSIRI